LTHLQVEFLIGKPGYFDDMPLIGPRSRRERLADSQFDQRLTRSELAFEILVSKYNCKDIIIVFDKKKGVVIWNKESRSIGNHLKSVDIGTGALRRTNEGGTIDDFIGALAFCISMQLNMKIAMRNSVRALMNGRMHFSSLHN